MTTTAILNVFLALGVIVMVVAPLVWAIVTQHRDHRVVKEGATVRSAHRHERRRAPRPRYEPARTASS